MAKTKTKGLIPQFNGNVVAPSTILNKNPNETGTNNITIPKADMTLNNPVANVKDITPTMNKGGSSGTQNKPNQTIAHNADGTKTVDGTVLSAEAYRDLLRRQGGDYGPVSSPEAEQVYNNQMMNTPEAQAMLRQKQMAEQFALKAGISRINQNQFGDYVNSDGTDIDWKQVGLSTAGDPSTWRNIASFAGGGALLGSSVAAPTLGLSIPTGLIIGAAIGVGSSILSNVRSQKSDNLTAQKLVLTTGQDNLNKLVNLVQVRPNNSQLYLDAYQQQLDRIAEAYSNLNADAQNNLNLLVEQDGTTQLARFNSFYAPGGSYEILNQKMQMALISPNAQSALNALAISQTNTYEQ